MFPTSILASIVILGIIAIGSVSSQSYLTDEDDFTLGSREVDKGARILALFGQRRRGLMGEKGQNRKDIPKRLSRHQAFRFGKRGFEPEFDLLESQEEDLGFDKRAENALELVAEELADNVEDKSGEKKLNEYLNKYLQKHKTSGIFRWGRK